MQRTTKVEVTLTNTSGAITATGMGFFNFTVKNNSEVRLVNVTLYVTAKTGTGQANPERIYLVPGSSTVDYIAAGGEWKGSVMLKASGPPSGQYSLDGAVYYDVERVDASAVSGSTWFQVIEGSR